MKFGENAMQYKKYMEKSKIKVFKHFQNICKDVSDKKKKKMVKICDLFYHNRILLHDSQ